MVSSKLFMLLHTTPPPTHSSYQAVFLLQNPPPKRHATTYCMTSSSPSPLHTGPSLSTTTTSTAHSKLYSTLSKLTTYETFTIRFPAYTTNHPPPTAHTSTPHSDSTLTHPKPKETQHPPSNFVPPILHGSVNAKTSQPRTASPTPLLSVPTLSSSGFLTTLIRPPNYIRPTTSTTCLLRLLRVILLFVYPSFADNLHPMKEESQFSITSSRTTSTSGSHNSLTATQLALSYKLNNPFCRNSQRHCINTFPPR